MFIGFFIRNIKVLALTLYLSILLRKRMRLIKGHGKKWILLKDVRRIVFRKGFFEYFASKDLRKKSVVLIFGTSFGSVHSMGLAIAIQRSYTY